MNPDSSATSTVNAAPVKSPTTTDLDDAHGAGSRLSWSRIALISVTVFVTTTTPLSGYFGGMGTRPLFVPLGLGLFWGLLAASIARWLRRTKSEARRETIAGLGLVVDVLSLTALLSQGGAAQHPFTLLYFVPITLATVIAPRWTVRIAILSVSCFGLLLVQTALALAEHINHAHHAHFFQHVQGMAVALAVVGAFVTFSVQGIARALGEKSRLIAQLSREQEQNQFAVSLGALSAGAAHELGSPLGTVQLLVEELPHLSGKEHDEALTTILGEVQRMKGILHGMHSSELSAETLGDGSAWAVAVLANTAKSLGAVVDGPLSGKTRQPRAVIEQILRELILNATRAAPNTAVHVSANASAIELIVRVSDNGPGLTEEQLSRALDPFTSTSGGTGLGLFLAHVHARQLGGRLELTSTKGSGTTALLTLPLDPPGRFRGDA